MLYIDLNCYDYINCKKYFQQKAVAWYREACKIFPDYLIA